MLYWIAHSSLCSKNFSLLLSGKGLLGALATSTSTRFVNAKRMLYAYTIPYVLTGKGRSGPTFEYEILEKSCSPHDDFFYVFIFFMFFCKIFVAFIVGANNPLILKSLTCFNSIIFLIYFHLIRAF
jgi:hypothetical protein